MTQLACSLIMAADSTAATEDPCIPDLEPLVIHNVTFNGKKLGDGSYGTVEEASVPGLECAAKRIHDLYLEIGSPEDIAHMRTTFVNECRLMSSLRHPHLVQFMGVCYPPGCKLPVLVMERLHTSLHERLESKEILPDNSKLSILIDVSRGVAYLHGHSPPIVHRDLTARNMLLTKSGVAKISDFGMARIVNIRPGQKVGTMTKGPGNAFYMPPEANEDHAKYSTPIDIFSFGNAALFTGTQKFPDLKNATYLHPKTRKLVARSEVERREESFALLRNGDPLTVLVEECLRDIPEDRPTSAQLLERLEGIRAQYQRNRVDVGRQQERAIAKVLSSKDAAGSCQHVIKVVMVGGICVGKSTLMYRFKHGNYPPEPLFTTIGMDYTITYFKIDGSKIKVFLWDAAGHERFDSVSKFYCKTADAIMILYNPTDRHTFDVYAKRWYRELCKEEYPEFVLMFVGTMSDLKERTVSLQEPMAFAEENNMMFIETSAKDGTNVDKAFIDLVTEVYYRKVKQHAQDAEDTQARTQQDKCIIS